MKILILALFLLCCNTAFCEIIVVTSNNDSGPGSLRQALIQAAANGFIDHDAIRFNLPGSSRNDFTIRLLSPLPGLSSNLSIDGSTQPSAPFGVSDARVIISPDPNVYIAPQSNGAALFISGKRDIELYGLYITGFRNLKTTAIPPLGPINSAIIIEESENIKIGAPGKGNLMFDNFYSLYSPGEPQFDTSNKVSLRSNIIGFTETGATPPSMNSDIRVACNEFTLGGDAATDGNYLFNSVITTGNNLSMKHNFIGIQPDNTIAAPPYYSSIVVTGLNLTLNNNSMGRVRFNILNSKNIVVQGNINISAGIPYVDFINCENGLFGGETPNEMNTFNISNFTIPVSSVGSKNIVIAKNSIICSETPYKITSPTNIPDIKVLVNNNTEYSGTANPNSEVYIYEDNTGCQTCNPVQFYTKVVADASGNWKITGSFTGKRWVSNATLLNNSSEFTQPLIEKTIPQSQYQAPYCGLNNGRIWLANLKNTIKVEWYNQSNVKVGEGTELNNIGPGTYYARGYNGNCYMQTRNLVLSNKTLSINSASLNVVQPSCNSSSTYNGAIRGLIGVAPDPLTYEWKNEAGALVGTAANLEQVGPGKYTLSVKISTCVITYGPVILTDPGFPQLNQSAMIVKPATCGNAVGSIRGIQATGTGSLTYTWKNAQQTVVANTLDLLNMPSGNYTLELKDESSCTPALTPAIEIPALNDITINETSVQITGSACSATNGSIKGFSVTGATVYQWYLSSGTFFRTTTEPELVNLPPGNYFLKASNTVCEKVSSTFTVALLPSVPFPVYSFISTDATCGQNNGTIEINTGTSVQPGALRWVNTSGQTLGNNRLLTNLDAGNYLLYLTDVNGCETLYHTYTISRVGILRIEDNNLQLKDDECGLGKGSVNGLTISGGKAPYIYKWVNEQGIVVAANLNSTSLKAGKYTLTVNDATNTCTDSKLYSIGNNEQPLAVPSAKNVYICAPGSALITVSDYTEGGNYKIYENLTGGQAIAENTNGIFSLSVSSSKDFYLSYSKGTCESARRHVSVEVSSAELKIPNNFTPNGDGINDYWAISGLENYPEATIKIFNRYGGKTYESRGYSSPFDGRQNNTNLPTGTYYYIIKLRTNCNIISGGVTILR